MPVAFIDYTVSRPSRFHLINRAKNLLFILQLTIFRKSQVFCKYWIFSAILSEQEISSQIISPHFFQYLFSFCFHDLFSAHQTCWCALIKVISGRQPPWPAISYLRVTFVCSTLLGCQISPEKIAQLSQVPRVFQLTISVFYAVLNNEHLILSLSLDFISSSSLLSNLTTRVEVHMDYFRKKCWGWKNWRRLASWTKWYSLPDMLSIDQIFSLEAQNWVKMKKRRGKKFIQKKYFEKQKHPDNRLKISWSFCLYKFMEINFFTQIMKLFCFYGSISIDPNFWAPIVEAHSGVSWSIQESRRHF